MSAILVPRLVTVPHAWCATWSTRKLSKYSFILYRKNFGNCSQLTLLTLNFRLALNSFSLSIVFFMCKVGVLTPRVHGWFSASSDVGLPLGSTDRSWKNNLHLLSRWYGFLMNSAGRLPHSVRLSLVYFYRIQILRYNDTKIKRWDFGKPHCCNVSTTFNFVSGIQMKFSNCFQYRYVMKMENQQRTNMKFRFKLGETATESREMLIKVYGEDREVTCEKIAGQMKNSFVLPRVCLNVFGWHKKNASKCFKKCLNFSIRGSVKSIGFTLLMNIRSCFQNKIKI